MTQKTLLELMESFELELLSLQYAPATFRDYKRRSNRLFVFAEARGAKCFTEELGTEFLKHRLGFDSTPISKELTGGQMKDVRVVCMIRDLQLNNTVARRYIDRRGVPGDSYYAGIKGEFQAYCTEVKQYSGSTTANYVRQSSRFMDYLIAHGIVTISEIEISDLNTYIRTLAGYSPKTVESNICAIRAFLRFLTETGRVHEDLAPRMFSPKARGRTEIPSVWTPDEVVRLLRSIDRGNPTGKRDYAVILLACRMGLRVSDIKKLTPDNFLWSENKLRLMQSKTRTELELPLVPDVGWAVIDYLSEGRPPADAPQIFVRHRAPFLPFSENNHLAQMIYEHMRRAHIRKSGRHRGMHSLRHTLASVLLENETPLPVISAIIGHASTSSTAAYLKVDLKRLRSCPLDLKEGSDCE